MRACHVAVMPGVRRGASSILLRSQLNRTSPQLSYSLNFGARSVYTKVCQQIGYTYLSSIRIPFNKYIQLSNLHAYAK